jgi:hypothetical protein
MPPQQGQNLLDFGNGLFNFRAHQKFLFESAPRLAERVLGINLCD